MKSTKAFQETIERYLSGKAAVDPFFETWYRNPEKNIGDCITYILNQVQKSGVNGFTDEEIYSMAVHYYVEKDINPGSPVNCQVIVNHHVELTEEEILEMKEKAKKEIFERETSRLRNVGKVTPAQTQQPTQLSLF